MKENTRLSENNKTGPTHTGQNSVFSTSGNRSTVKKPKEYDKLQNLR
jgi:hypothetical protein